MRTGARERIARVAAWLRAAAPSREAKLAFRCNVCDTGNRVPRSRLGREERSCRGCGSTVRARAMLELLSRALFDASLPLSRFPSRPDLRGIGLSDWEGYAGPLARRLGYRNTFFDREPRLDVQAPDPADFGTLDFAIASDVMEHVAPPVEEAFRNLRRLLRPGGVLLLSVPWDDAPETREHYPELHRFEIVRRHGEPLLVNHTRDGRRQEFDGLVFHGGSGATLELRRFSLAGLHASLAAAGFATPQLFEADCEAHGIVWLEPWSRPMSVRAP